MRYTITHWLCQSIAVVLVVTTPGVLFAGDVKGSSNDAASSASNTPIADSVREHVAAVAAQTARRRSDSLVNGALIGAGIAVGAGLAFCTAMEPWDNCRDDYGPMLRIGAIGAAIGVAIDALIRERVPATTRITAAPLVSRDAKGMQVTTRF
jgi:hypothetical protein